MGAGEESNQRNQQTGRARDERSPAELGKTRPQTQSPKGCRPEGGQTERASEASCEPRERPSGATEGREAQEASWG